jgi:hypothetical protein
LFRPAQALTLSILDGKCSDEAGERINHVVQRNSARVEVPLLPRDPRLGDFESGTSKKPNALGTTAATLLVVAQCAAIQLRECYFRVDFANVFLSPARHQHVNFTDLPHDVKSLL